ncbi:MAG TPA: dienelactone hydrolase family protein [Tepidisphaeraceae bacterium]|jgi:carboxymethylenebutenolidase|nr:dienelactone hydrolase family protein [Tepidisphaeraceae bacterium]
MKRTLLLSTVIALSMICLARADDPTSQPAKNLAPSADTATSALKNSPRHGEWVDVPMGDVKIKTWVVYPEVKDKAPVVIVIHEIFGMTDWVRSVADQLAAEGFIAVAPDLLSGMGPDGGGTESLGNNVGQTIRKLTAEDQAKRIDAVRDYALAQPSASDKSATIGFCWGGGASFAYAVHQPKLNAAVVYYGTPPKKDDLAKIACPILGCYGGNDAHITATVEPTKATMAELKKDYAPNVYDGAGHGFLRQQTGQNGANLKAAQQAWPTTIEFLKKNLK